MAYRRPLAVAYSCGAVAEFHRASRLSGQRIAIALLHRAATTPAPSVAPRETGHAAARFAEHPHDGCLITPRQNGQGLAGMDFEKILLPASYKNHWRRSVIDSPIEVDLRMWVLGRSPDSRGVDRNGLPRIAPSGLLRSVSLRLQWRGPCRSLTGFPTTPSSSFIGEEWNCRQGILGAFAGRPAGRGSSPARQSVGRARIRRPGTAELLNVLGGSGG